MTRLPTLLLAGLLLAGGCEDPSATTIDYVDIDATVTDLALGGYGGYITAAWNVVNTSPHDLDGWEITVRVITLSYQLETGIFFRHDAKLAAGDSAVFENNIFFHKDAEDMYPVTLSDPDTTIRKWDVLAVKGLIIH